MHPHLEQYGKGRKAALGLLVYLIGSTRAYIGCNARMVLITTTSYPAHSIVKVRAVQHCRERCLAMNTKAMNEFDLTIN